MGRRYSESVNRRSVDSERSTGLGQRPVPRGDDLDEVRPWRSLALAVAVSLVTLPGALSASDFSIGTANPRTGSYHARVEVERTCAAGDATVPNGDLSSDPAQVPCGKLTANDVDVVSGEVHFRAGSVIQLGDGFSVADGAGFVAEAGPAVRGEKFVRDESPLGESAYHVRFYLDASGLTMDDDTDQFENLVAYDRKGAREFAVGIRRNTSLGENRVWAEVFEQTGSSTTKDGNELLLPDGYHFIEVAWYAASSGSAEDGLLEICVDDSPGGSNCQLLRDLDNPGEINSVAWGALAPSDGHHGSFDMDDFDSRRVGPIGAVN